MARIGTRQLAAMCNRVGTSLQAGVDVRRVWDQEAMRGNAQYRRHATEVSRLVSKGLDMAEALRSCNGYFPRLTCEMVAVGEETGQVEAVFLKLAAHYDHLLRLRRTFLAGIAWPMIQLVAGIIILGLLILILGLISKTSPGVFGLAGPSGLMTYCLIVGLATGAIVLATLAVTRGWLGTWPYEVLVRIPGVGTSIRTMALARLAWTLSMALNAGVEARRAMGLALDSTQIPFYTRHKDSADAVILRGGEFHEALRKTGAFPEEFLDEVENAEVAGTQTESLSRLAEQYRERAEASSKVLAVLAGFAVWGIIAVVFVFVIVNMVYNLYIRPINEALEWAS
jgi:type II secretory pathway component PulF